jgi:hypothetical protein
MQDEIDQKILGGALKAIVRVLLTNGNNTVIGHALVDGRIVRVEIRIKEVVE